MKALFVVAVLAASAAGLPALAQDGGADPHAPGAYAGVDKQAFYDVDARIMAMEAKADALPPGQARRAKAAIAGIRSFEKVQRARHNGELLDWDREALNVRLDKLAASMPALA